jgi:hypothetical protein
MIMRKVLLGSIFSIGLLALMPAIAANDLPYSPTAGAIDNTIPGYTARATELFSTEDGIEVPGFAVISSHLTDDGLDDFETVGADDFTVPDCGWEISNIVAFGNYSTEVPMGGTGPAASVNVYILPKTGTTIPSTDLAGSAIWFGEGLPYTELDLVDGGDLSIALPDVVLTEGDYWLVVQANMEFLNVGQWNWTESGDTPAGGGGIIGDESNWYQLSGTPVTVVGAGGLVNCQDAFGRRITDCDMTRPADPTPNPERDFAFIIEGEVLTPGVTASQASINTVEDGSAVVYTVVLDAPPSDGATVTVTPSSTDVTEGTVSGALMFTQANWDIPQNVTVTPGASGDGNDGDVMYMVDHAVSSTAVGGCYDGVVAGSVNVTNANIDGVATITVDPSSGLTVSEDGTVTATFTVTAVGVPSDDVTVGLTNNSPTEVTVAASAVLNAGNGYSADVTVTGVSDDVVEGPQPFSITTDAATSTDPMYNGVNPVDVSGTVTDDNTADVNVTANPDPLATSETDVDGGANEISYVLSSQPSADVTLTLNVTDPTEASLDTNSLTFTNANWNVTQVVTVSGEDDDIDDGTVAYQVIVSNTSSADPNYDGLAISPVNGNNADDGDTAGFSVDVGDGVVTNETGTTDTFTVTLDSEPVFPVSLDFTSQDTTEGWVSSDGITFGATATVTLDNTNWDTGVTVTVQGQDDDIRDDGDIVYDITGSNIDTFDPAYGLLSDGDIPTVSATNEDDADTAGLIVSETSLVFDEDGAPQTFNVRLNSEPTVPSVTIPITSGDTTEATVSPASLTFTTANWGTDQVVTVTPVLDFEIDDDQMFDVTVGPANGGNYTGLTDTVGITVNNIDICGEMTLDVEIDESIIAYGTPTCLFDLYKTNGSPDPADWTYLGTFSVGAGGSVDTGVLGEEDCSYVTTISGTTLLLTPYPFATVPTLGEWGMIAMISLLAMAGIVSMRRRKADA